MEKSGIFSLEKQIVFSRFLMHFGEKISVEKVKHFHCKCVIDFEGEAFEGTAEAFVTHCKRVSIYVRKISCSTSHALLLPSSCK